MGRMLMLSGLPGITIERLIAEIGHCSLINVDYTTR